MSRHCRRLSLGRLPVRRFPTYGRRNSIIRQESRTRVTARYQVAPFHAVPDPCVLDINCRWGKRAKSYFSQRIPILGTLSEFRGTVTPAEAGRGVGGAGGNENEGPNDPSP
jgi:hypothetical protein